MRGASRNWRNEAIAAGYGRDDGTAWWPTIYTRPCCESSHQRHSSVGPRMREGDDGFWRRQHTPCPAGPVARIMPKAAFGNLRSGMPPVIPDTRCGLILATRYVSDEPPFSVERNLKNHRHPRVSEDPSVSEIQAWALACARVTMVLASGACPIFRRPISRAALIRPKATSGNIRCGMPPVTPDARCALIRESSRRYASPSSRMRAARLSANLRDGMPLRHPRCTLRAYPGYALRQRSTTFHRPEKPKKTNVILA